MTIDPLSAIKLSVMVAVACTVVGLPVAVALGWLLARRSFPGKSIASALVMLPLVLPPVVTGLLLLEVLGRNALLGRALHVLGVDVPFTLLGATVAAFTVGMPLYVSAARSAFETLDPHLENVSLTLGVPPRRTFWRVSLPLALPGVASGAVLAFARALGEFGATAVVAGNIEGQTRTIALAVYTLLATPDGGDALWLLVGASVVISLTALVGHEILVRRMRTRLEVD